MGLYEQAIIFSLRSRFVELASTIRLFLPQVIIEIQLNSENSNSDVLSLSTRMGTTG